MLTLCREGSVRSDQPEGVDLLSSLRENSNNLID